jgi:hypothetical protein
MVYLFHRTKMIPAAIYFYAADIQYAFKLKGKYCGRDSLELESGKGGRQNATKPQWQKDANTLWANSEP